ncbi:MAG: DUF1932 domain-containing protein [Gemmataceae bacterium]
MTQPPNIGCVGILYCGDLGAAMARSLRKTGIRVVTTCEGRSSRTRERADDAEVEILSSLNEVVRNADLLVSVVLPDAAEALAQACAERNQLAPPNALFLDVNSIDLESLASIERVTRDAGFRYVDGAIHGGAARLEQMGVLYLSGPHIAEVETVFAPAFRVLALGETLGHATRMKLLMAGQSKCLNMLFLQIATLAHNAGMLDEFLTESRTFYPAIMTAIERMLPTYPVHAARRVTELQGIENLARSVDANDQIIRAARELLQTVAGAWRSAEDLTPLDIPSIVKLAASLTTHHC